MAQKKFIDFVKDLCSFKKEDRVQKVTDYIISFAISRSLKYQKDNIGNIVISNGEKTDIMLASNIDSVFVEGASSFLKIFLSLNQKMIYGDDFIFCKNASFGAGEIGAIATILYVLDNGVGNIGAIFTVAKYQNMFGVKSLKINNFNKLVMFESSSQNVVFTKSLAENTGTIKFNNDKIFLKTDINFKTFRLKISGIERLVENKNMYLELVLELLDKIPNLFINKIILDINGENEIVFSTTNFDLEIRKIVKDFYNKYKTIYKNLFLSLIRETKNSLVLKDTDFLIFMRDFKQGVIRQYNDEYQAQYITSVNTNSGQISVCLLSSSEKSCKKMVDELENFAKEKNYSCNFDKLILNYDRQTSLSKDLIEYLNANEGTLRSSSEAGIYNDKVKKLELSIISLPILSVNSVDEKIPILELEKRAESIKNFFANYK